MNNTFSTISAPFEKVGVKVCMSFEVLFFFFSLVFHRAEETNQHHSFFFFLIVSVYVIEAMDMSFEVNDQFLNHYMGMLCYHDDG